jgi:hypothetical protein
MLVQEYASNRLEIYPIFKEVLGTLLPNRDKNKTVLELFEKEAERFKSFKNEMSRGGNLFSGGWLTRYCMACCSYFHIYPASTFRSVI